MLAVLNGIKMPILSPTIDEQAEGSDYGHRMVRREIDDDFMPYEIRAAAAKLIGNEYAAVLCRERHLQVALINEREKLTILGTCSMREGSLKSEVATLKTERDRARWRIRELEKEVDELRAALPARPEEVE